MNLQIKLVIESKKNRSDFIFEDIVTSFKELLLSYTKKAPQYYKEDIYQRLLFGLFIAINKFDVIHYEINPKYFKKFTEKYRNVLYINATTTIDEKKNFVNEYNLFCNENQFINYLNKVFLRVVIDFYREYKEEFSLTFISFNNQINEEQELIDITSDSISDNISPLDKYAFTNDELEFINVFIDEKKVLSERAVAQKLGISQQAVNKRKSKIVKKYSLK